MPSPGPTSSTLSPGPIPAWRTMRSTMPRSNRKCWPSPLFGRMPSSSMSRFQSRREVGMRLAGFSVSIPKVSIMR